MQININIPLKSEIVHSTKFEVKIASSEDNEAWSAEQLGAYAEEQGVYIHHCNGKILYIGKTTEGRSNFGFRLYRQFHRGASNNSKLHQLLAKQIKPIYTYLLDLSDVDKMVNAGAMSLTPKDKALIMELVLIGIYKPEGNGKKPEDETKAEG